MIKIKLNNIIDLDNTITCGQIFRYIKEADNSYTILLSDRVINVKNIDNYLYVDSNNYDNLDVIIKEYYDLNRDYISIMNNIKLLDKNIVSCVNNSIGLKMIKQDKLECIIEYIISANNSVRNITNSLNLISERYGEKILFNNKEYYLFPKLDKLINVSASDFRECKVGFRDKYLVDIIKSIYNKKLDLDYIDKLNSFDALEYLKQFKGIGTKVASCILLFSYQRFDVFPIDTWVKKFMKCDYGIEGENSIKKYCIDTYKEYCGLAIQYMFNGKRNKNM